MMLGSLMRKILGGESSEGSPQLLKSTVAVAHLKPSSESIKGPKLNLGSGWDIRDGWVNIDMNASHKPDIVADATRLSQIDDNYAGYAVAQDILEHIHRDRCMTALREWNRVLRLGGLLEVRTTDVIEIAKLMNEPDRNNPEGHNLLLRCMFGTQGYEGDFHLNGFTEVWLTDALEKAGFEVVYLGHHDHWLLDIVGKKVTHTPPDPLVVNGTDEEFLEAAYQRVLGRTIDTGGKKHWLAQLAAGIPREVILTALEDAKE
jgi:predicted SAM-dependent methyltransferase